MQLVKRVLMILCVGITTPCFAIATLGGPTGLITMPTAEILGYKEYALAYDYQMGLGKRTKNKNFYKMNVGALNNTELGFVGGSQPDEGVFLNFKWNMTSNQERFPLKMAVGFQNLTSTTQSDFYIVTSKKMRADLGLHAGFNALFEDDVNVSLMAGADYAFDENILFMGDISSAQDNIYHVNVAALYAIKQPSSSHTLYLRAAVENMLRNKEADSYFSLGLCYMSVL